MKWFKLLLCLALGSIVLQSCKNEPKRVIKTEPVVFKKEGELMLYPAEKDSVLAKLNIEIAETDYETQTGLMYRQGMEKNQGMLFIFPDVAMHSFYMKNTEFSIDLIFIKEDLTVGSIQENAQPLSEKSLSSKVPIKYVLEVNSGLTKNWSLKVGDRISFKRL